MQKKEQGVNFNGKVPLFDNIQHQSSINVCDYKVEDNCSFEDCGYLSYKFKCPAKLPFRQNLKE